MPAPAAIPQIFDPRAGIAQAHRRQADAFLTQQLALRASERLQALASLPPRVTLLGPLAPALRKAFPATEFLPAGIDAIGRLQCESNVDCILDLGTLGLVNDLPGALAQIRRALAPGGVFFGLLYGGGSLHEVRQALLQAETQLTGGIAPRLHPTLSGEAALQLLQRAGFEAPIADRELLTAGYKAFRDLACDLREAGLSNQLAARTRTISPRGLFNATESIWRDRAPAANGRMQATFEIIALTGWSAALAKPSE